MNLGFNLLYGMMFGPAAVTMAFTYADIGGGVAGIVNTTTNATYAFMMSGGRGVWTGVITGTEAILKTARTGGTSPFGFALVSVDGGGFVSAAKPVTDFILFTGLSDTSHTVIVRYADAYGEKSYIEKAGNILSIVGAAPSVKVSGIWTSPFDGTSNSTFAAVRLNTSIAGFTPPYTPNQDYSKSMTVKTSATEMQIFNIGGDVHVSIDGGADTAYPVTTNPSITIVTLDGLSHTYRVWGDAGGLLVNSTMSVGINGTFEVVPAAKSLIQFGDSITAGVGATNNSYVDVYRLAANFGYNGLALGSPGEATVQLATRLTNTLPNLTPTNNLGDVIILATGRNDGTWNTTISDAYTSCVNQLRAVYGKVLCRGVLPDGFNNFSSQNNGISAVVTALADPNVIYINVDAWSGIATADGTHPTDAGYDTIEGYALTAYAPYL